MVIRPFNEEEKAYYSQFIAETEHGVFKNPSPLKDETKKLRSMQSHYRKLKKLKDTVAMESLDKEIQSQYDLVVELRKESGALYTEDSDRHAIFDRDYERRMDLYNTCKINNDLILVDMNEYDKFSTEAELDIEVEHILLDRMVYPTVRKRKKQS